MDGINLALYPQPQLCPLGLSIDYGLLWCPYLHCGASLDNFLQAFATFTPTSPPYLLSTYTLSYAGPKLVRTSKK